LYGVDRDASSGISKQDKSKQPFVINTLCMIELRFYVPTDTK